MLALHARGQRHIEIRYGHQRLCRYNLRPSMTPIQGPRPYFHPVQTLEGQVVTMEKPYDHEWHSGISLACPWVSGFNFWGGPTFVRDQGYQQLDNMGYQVHRTFTRVMPHAADRAQWQRWEQTLDWRTPDQRAAPLLQERRTQAVGGIVPTEGYWCLDFDFALTNPGPNDVIFGSPTTEGRPMAGYGGVFWRGPMDLLHGTVLAEGGVTSDTFMGQRSAWIAYVGRHHTGQCSTVVLLDHPANVRFPLKWFVRTTPFPVASFAFSFDEYLSLAPGALLARRQRILICDGARTHGEISTWYERWLTRTPA